MREDSQPLCYLTGASGFLGRHFAPALGAAGWRVVCVGVERSPHLAFVSFDLAGRSPAGRLEPGARAVFHLGGLAHRVPRTAAEADAFFEINARGTCRLLEELDNQEARPESFVLISTVAVYGRESGEHLTEQTPRSAQDPYGRSKIEAEDRLLDWSARRGVRAVILRLPLVVGAGAPGNFGRMVEAMRRGRYVGIGSGEARRSMVLAEDVARFASQLATVTGIYHLTDGRHPSFRELEEALCHALGRVRPWRLPIAAARLAAGLCDVGESLTGRGLPFGRRTLEKMTATLTFSDERARAELGWEPRPVVPAVQEILERWRT